MVQSTRKKTGKWRFILLGLAAFLLFALVTLPATVLLNRLDAFGVQAAGVEGSVWRGRAQMLQVANTNIGGVTWKLHALPLFTGRAVADVHVTRNDGFAEGRITLAPSSVQFATLTASLPLSALPPKVLPGGWTGTANMKFASLSLQDGWPMSADGTLDLMNLTGPARNPANLGNYKLTFPAANTPAVADTLIGALTDEGGGPLQITGTLQLKSDHSYLIQGLVATKPDTPPNVVNALQFLGAPDAQGRREFSLSGTM